MTTACRTASYNRTTYRVSNHHARSGRKTHRREAQALRIQKIIVSIIFTVVIAFICGISFGSFLSKAESSAEQADVRYKYYESVTLESGESLWSLAKEEMKAHDMFGDYESIDAYIEDVCQINSIDDASTVHAGSHVILPYFSGEYK